MSGRANGSSWACVACYLFIPLTSLGFLIGCRGHGALRFHARQGTIVGLLYIGLLLALSLLDALGGAVFRWAGAFVAAAAPVVGGFTTMVWAVVVWQVMQGRAGRIPVIGRWAE